MYHNPLKNKEKIFAIAPMLDWTDRHCRFLHRQLTRHSLLFTEMITSAAIIHGDVERLLGYDEIEHPVAVQLGGSNPEELARATKVCDQFGYDEINLNVGCPSDRVQAGRFGACLMAEPEHVAKCIVAMKEQTDRPVTVKCRIGIDDMDIGKPLDDFVDAVIGAGVSRLYVHARKAWLSGLSPKENRTIPPLDYPRVYDLAKRLAPFPVIINGGIETLEQVEAQFENVSGVMMGRAAYHNPMLLTKIDGLVYGDSKPAPSLAEIIDIMCEYAANQTAKGVRLNSISRHMIGLAYGLPGARRFRQIMTMDVLKEGAGPHTIMEAFQALKI
ncbi:MAG: tRNA dihydrouridine(20/20a) synthase DusA [Devosiaceae bacterium]|nr:tRNA dihydrouridine(20/20a) synthase DusA [Devosiaceae bacterium]